MKIEKKSPHVLYARKFATGCGAKTSENSCCIRQTTGILGHFFRAHGCARIKVLIL